MQSGLFCFFEVYFFEKVEFVIFNHLISLVMICGVLGVFLYLSE